MTRSTSLRTLLFATMVAGVTTVGAQPSTFRITQVYSTLDGAVQYVELTESAGLNGQHRLAGLTLTSEHNGVVKRFMFTEDLPTDQTAYRSIIVSNTSLTLIFGSIGSLFAPVFFEYTPDVKWLPTRFLPTDGGTLDFAGVDQMKYAALPNDGATALYRDGAARQATVPDHARGQRNNVFHSWVYAVEYYHAATDRYFISASAPDIEALDSGRLPGWSRTDESLSVGASPITSPYLRQPVCRFHIPPGEGDSHFLSASSEECAAVQAKFPRLTLETDAAFHVILPASTGACPYSALIGQRWNVVIPVYRLWKPHGGSNHRYTTNDAVRDEMLRRGWVSEGYGPMGVAMCALGSPWDY